MIRYRTRWAILCQIGIYAGLFMTGCSTGQEGTPDLADYYLPLSTLSPEGVTYRYQNQQDALAPLEVWFHQKLGSDRTLSINYDPEGREVLRQYDRFVENGVVIDSLVLISHDSTGKQHPVATNVISPNRFPFDVTDTSMIWLTRLEWWQPLDSLHIVLARRRKFDGDTVWFFGKKERPAVRFTVEDTFETERVGWSSSQWSGEEIYARGIGLVYYKRQITNDLSLEFGLNEIE
jgi:hypothetical protein